MDWAERAQSVGVEASNGRASTYGNSMTGVTLSQRLTIVTTTHLIPSAPSVWILRKTVRSIRARLGVSDCTHLVYYDAPKEESPRHLAYLRNLETLAREFSLTLLVRRRSGLKMNYLDAVDRLETPYMLFLEHDWVFRRRVDITGLLDVFDRCAFVNFVKFNKQPNGCRAWWDHQVEPEDRVSAVPLTRTSCWTNNPHIVRISKWREEWRSIVGDEKASGSFGLEEKLYWAYGRDIFNTTFPEAHRKWGCYIYGSMSDGPTVKHTNGSLSINKIFEPLAKLERLVKRKVGIP